MLRWMIIPLLVGSIALASCGRTESPAANSQGTDSRSPAPEGLDLAKLSDLGIEELRATQGRQALSPYELINGPTSPALADEVMTIGLVHAGLPAFRLEPPIDWSFRVLENRSWNYHLNSWRPIDSVLGTYDVTRDPRYLRFGLDVALDWIASNRTYAQQMELDEPPSDFTWYDMAVGLRLYRLAYLLDAACREETIDNATLEILWRSLLDHLSYLNDDANIRFHNNHGLFQAAGQLAAARRFDWLETMRSVSEQATDRFVRMTDTQFSREGVHLEHSPGYHQAVLDLLKAFRTAGLVPAALEIDERIAAMELALSWMITPSGKLVTFGDTDLAPATALPPDELSRVHPVLAYRLIGGASGTPPTSPIGVYPESGYIALRFPASDDPNAPPTEDTFLAQQAAFHSRTHKHADDLTFIWSERGRDIFIDAGRYGYLGQTDRGSELARQGFWYSDPKRIYVESTHAHNTVEIDGQCYSRVSDPPYGSALRGWGRTGSIRHVLTEVGHLGSIRHRRLLVLNPARWLIVIDLLDDAAGERHEFTQWFHAGATFDATLDPDGMVRLADQTDGVTIYGASLLAGSTPLPPVRGQVEPRLQGWWSPRPNVLEPNAALGFQIVEAAQATFATLFMLDERPSVDLAVNRDQPDTGALDLSWVASGGSHRLHVRNVESDEDLELVYTSER